MSERVLLSALNFLCNENEATLYKSSPDCTILTQSGINVPFSVSIKKPKGNSPTDQGIDRHDMFNYKYQCLFEQLVYVYKSENTLNSYITINIQIFIIIC